MSSSPHPRPFAAGDQSSPFASQSEMAQRMRQFDWTTTPLGPVENWPKSLQSTARILLTSRFAMWMGWGPDLTFLYNDAYARMTLGAKHPGALGKPSRDVWPEIWKEIGPRIDAVMRTGEATWEEGLRLFLERSGYVEETYHTFSYSPLADDDGRIVGMLCVVSEETARVIGERRLRTLRGLAAGLNSTMDAARIARNQETELAKNDLDLPFTLTYFFEEDGSARLAAHTGIESGHPLAPARIAAADAAAPWPVSLTRTASSPVVVDGLQDLPRGGWDKASVQAMVVPLAHQGQARPAGFFVAGVNPYRRLDADYTGFVGLVAGQIASAFASSRAYEQERRRAESLAELDRAKTTFFSNVSHELRTPLTLLLGPIEDELADGALSPVQRGRAELAHRNALRLLKLVNSLLDFSRIEAGRMQAAFEPVDLGALTADLARLFAAAAERGGLALDVSCPSSPEPVYVDREMWEKIVLNLLSNALKFTLRGKISVKVAAIGSGYELSVSDTGAGVPADQLPRLFERFHRVENTPSRTHEGTGIGLALVQELVKLHGGTISAESELGRGTVFRVRIPSGSAHLPPERVKKGAPADRARLAPYLEEAERWDATIGTGRLAAEGTGASLSVATRGAKILVADDNADMREYLAKLLSSYWEVEAVADGEAALAAARAAPPELVLSDVMMPKLGGFALMDGLRAADETRDIPVILLSARAGEEAALEGVTRGADDYLTKPFTTRELVTRLDTHIRLSRVRAEAAAALRRRAAQLRTLIDAAPIGVYLVDADFRLLDVNPVARPFFGDVPELIGQDFEKITRRIWPKELSEEILRRFRHTLATGEPYHTPELVEKRQDRAGEECYEWRITRLALPDGRFGVVCYVRDISAEVGARRVISAANVQLEQKVLERTAELRTSNLELEAFCYSVAHDLRAPLRGISSFSQLLARRLESVVDDRSKEELARILANGERMSRLIDALLGLSRVTRRELSITRVDLSELAASVNSDLAKANPGRRLSFEAEPGLATDGDAALLRALLQNLLENAWKFTARADRPEIRFGRRPGAEGAYYVRDNGAGFDPDYAGKLFVAFQRLHADSDFPGSGIGLATAQRIVLRHGGRIWAEGALGKGASFFFTLGRPHALS